MTVKIHKDEAANAIFVEDSNGVQFLNSLQALMDDPSDTVLDIKDLARDIFLFKGVAHDYFLDTQGNTYGATPVAACDALNALFASAGSSTGDAPVVTSSTSVALTEGDTLNYELVATNGVGYEWLNLPSGITTVEGNVRKLIGGSGLAVGTYNITAKAINYFGEDTETIVLTVSAPPYSNTKSINFQNQDYMGANATLLDGIFGRDSNGAGSGDAWSVSLWFKGSTETSGQTIFYFGDSDVVNSGYVELRQTNDNGQKRLRLHYGSNSNHLRLQTTSGSIAAETWQHILVTYDGGTTGAGSGDIASYYSRFSIYINGVLQSTSDSNSNYGYSSGVDPDNFRLGRQSSGQYLRNARIDELAVWGSDQSANISAIYNSGSTHDLSTLTTAPDHWWRMGDGDTYPNIQDNVGSAHFVMYNMTAADIVTDAP
jgi:hypothetical protein